MFPKFTAPMVLNALTALRAPRQSGYRSAAEAAMPTTGPPSELTSAGEQLTRSARRSRRRVRRLSEHLRRM